MLHFEDSLVGGAHGWGTIATYELSSGDTAEALLNVDSLGRGEAYLAINGDIISHVAIEYTAGVGERSSKMTTWLPDEDEIAYPPELIAELVHGDVGDAILNRLVPQEFKCSRFGKKALKAGKYMWIGLVAASGTVCCMATAEIACPACVGAAAIGVAAGSEAIDGYCE